MLAATLSLPARSVVISNTITLSLQVTVFEQEHFQGKCLEFTSECCNIQECGLDNIRSIRVESGA